MSKEQRDDIKKRLHQSIHRGDVTVIPANPNVLLDVHDRIERVGPYCRVSTLANEQVESYEIQKEEYTKLISEHPNWTIVDVYADEGISATSIKHRKDFLRLLDDCRAHKVTLILTKSVTRFARNIVDCISICRELKQLNPPVGIYFETENIFTLDQDSEMMLNLYSVVAQSESETKSMAVKWGIRKRFAMGIPRLCALYGYKYIKKFEAGTQDEGDRTSGRLEIDKEAAAVVKAIYSWYLAGLTLSEISTLLSQSKVKSPKGNDRWSHSSLFYVLTNERYTGHVIMQKTYTADIFSHRSVKNNGVLTKYHLADNHPAIIPEEDWIVAQAMLLKYGWNEFLIGQKSLVLDEKTRLFAVDIQKKFQPFV
ncbi:recombinase family protein [uncultured Flavonifractor sp.]|uniref:recombinase family protein n=1 Tax=uncultured Flavonifractor sp. TaxID=1193534 RepID=UPI0025984590|nr:recombinase family protein [uncultured Flavonifractor sp.]